MDHELIGWQFASLQCTVLSGSSHASAAAAPIILLCLQTCNPIQTWKAKAFKTNLDLQTCEFFSNCYMLPMLPAPYLQYKTWKTVSSSSRRRCSSSRRRCSSSSLRRASCSPICTADGIQIHHASAEKCAF